MKINIGSKNQVKIKAVKEVLREYKHFSQAVLYSFDSDSGVPKQPKSIDDVVLGARNRAERAFGDCAYSLGMESGLIAVPHTNTGYMDICACMIYDGKHFFPGLSPGFELPLTVTRMILDDGLDANDAFLEAGLTRNPKLGSADGTIGLLTDGRVKRKEQIKIAIRMALIQAEKPSLYDGTL